MGIAALKGVPRDMLTPSPCFATSLGYRWRVHWNGWWVGPLPGYRPTSRAGIFAFTDRMANDKGPHSMLELYDQIQEVRKAIEARWDGKPRVGVILGTGLGNLVQDMERQATLAYEDIPHFPHSTVHSHAGQLVCGLLGGKPAVVMEGRVHFYEVYSLKQITLPVRVMKALGCEVLVVSNACGGMNPQFAKGDLMIIEDHINLIGDNPLIGKNDDRLGIRLPDMCCPYGRSLIELAQRG